MNAIPPAQTKATASFASHHLAKLLLAAALPWMTQCGHIGGYKSVVFSKAKLATPPTTLSEREYPFDEKGNYRTDWVKNGSTKPRSESSFRTASTSPAQTLPSVNEPAPPTSSSHSQAKTKKQPSRMTVASNTTQAAEPPPPPVYTPAPTPPPPKPPVEKKPQARYHTIAKGDTLWGISRKYKIPVDAIKSANGLSSDLIRPGQTLRLP
jgi:LysM repeat protein